MDPARPMPAVSERAWRAFQMRVAELGGTVLEPSWLGTGTRHRVRCQVGHDAAPRPSDVKQGGGICPACAGNDTAAAELAFRARVAELGGTVLEPSWLGAMKPHRIRCAAGHEGAPRPHDVLNKGTGICRACAGRDPVEAERAFRARVAELGGTLLERSWLGALTPHRAICAAGHPCTPLPASVQQGGGICWECRSSHPANLARIARASSAAERTFRERVAELGGTVLEPSWLGNDRPHRIRCAAGHEGAPRPAGVQQGQGICRTCAGNDPVACERAFRARVAKLGGTVLEPFWLGRDARHRVRCAAGHVGTPRPGNVLNGSGLCRTCAGKVWDAFYVVSDDARGRVKFGITSGDPRPRLGTHARNGYGRVLRLLVDLPGDTAPDLERDVLAALRLAGEEPVQGREHFAADVVALVLDVVDNYPMQQTPPAIPRQSTRAR